MSDYIRTLLNEKGKDLKYDPMDISKATFSSYQSHMATLKRNHKEPEDFIDNTISKLNDLTDKKHRPLKDEYKRQIGMSIKRALSISHPGIKIDLSAFYRSRKRANENRPTVSLETIKNLKKIIVQASEILKKVKYDERITDLALYDTCLAILLSTYQSWRINEILQLKLSHKESIWRSDPLNVKSKGNDNTTRILMKNDITLKLFDFVLDQRYLVERSIMSKKHDKSYKKQMDRYTEDYFIISSTSYMRKKLKVVAAMAEVDEEGVGFNMFRKYMVTFLIDEGNANIAQIMNNHSSLNTTTENYRIRSNHVLGSVLNDLGELKVQLSDAED